MKGKPFSRSDAIAIAEKFVAAKPAGTELFRPHAVGARLDSGFWFVGFDTLYSANLRGVSVDADTRAAKLLKQNLKRDWLLSGPVEKPATQSAGMVAGSSATSTALAGGLPGVTPAPPASKKNKKVKKPKAKKKTPPPAGDAQAP
jgi:hypothetical protein